jgi:hypothetical protein
MGEVIGVEDSVYRVPAFCFLYRSQVGRGEVRPLINSGDWSLGHPHDKAEGAAERASWPGSPCNPIWARWQASQQ